MRPGFMTKIMDTCGAVKHCGGTGEAVAAVWLPDFVSDASFEADDHCWTDRLHITSSPEHCHFIFVTKLNLFWHG